MYFHDGLLHQKWESLVEVHIVRLLVLTKAHVRGMLEELHNSRRLQQGVG